MPNKYLTFAGAYRLALAFEQASSPEVLRYLECLALNLGCERLETVGTTIYYKPLRHKDTVSGYLPGDAVTVSRCGFSFEGRVLIRAEVH